MRQADLFGPTIERRFRAFHEANPHVYQCLLRGARKLRRAGWEHYGIAALYEGLRYEAALRTAGDDWKLNNDFRCCYARMLMEREPELAGFFSTRARRAA